MNAILCVKSNHLLNFHVFKYEVQQLRMKFSSKNTHICLLINWYFTINNLNFKITSFYLPNSSKYRFGSIKYIYTGTQAKMMKSILGERGRESERERERKGEREWPTPIKSFRISKARAPWRRSQMDFAENKKILHIKITHFEEDIRNEAKCRSYQRDITGIFVKILNNVKTKPFTYHAFCDDIAVGGPLKQWYLYERKFPL